MSRGLIGLIAAAVLAILTAPLWRQIVPRIGSLASNTTTFDTGGPQTVTFVCADGNQFQVAYFAQQVRLTLPTGNTYELGQTGTNRYSNGEYTFFTQNNSGFVERNEAFVYSNCSPQASIPSPSPTQTPSPSPTLTPNPSPTLTPNPSPVPTATPLPTPIPGAVSYVCPDGQRFQVRYYSNQAEVFLNGAAYYLSQVSTGSGVRYTDGYLVLETQGNQATLDRDGFPLYIDCIAENVGDPVTPTPRPSPPNALW